MPRLILLGGFLGSGKTTTLLRLADRLAKQGRRVGILTNDQGQDLVDTELFRASGHPTRDVRGGCFCCRLDDFVARAQEIISAHQPEFLLAEPVGSCTDLVATVLRPLREVGGPSFEIAPYTVLVDPIRARDALAPTGRATLSEKVTYIYLMQQMEADAIAINKVDSLPAEEIEDVAILLGSRFPALRTLRFSARTGEGFDELAAWLVGAGEPSERRSPDVDYEVYAQGEAELAWFDGRFIVSAARELDLDESLLVLAGTLRDRLSAARLEIAHAKLLLTDGFHTSAVNVVGSGSAPQFSRAARHRSTSGELLVNLRVAASPVDLRTNAEACIQRWAEETGASLACNTSSAFSPPRPSPRRRISGDP